MSTKRFHIPASQIRDMARGHGRCFATDIITVNGQRVGYMYREAPSDRDDSGWRFFAATEDEAYVNDPKNVEIYDVNTIANYDPAIIPLLDAPVGSAFERSSESGAFIEAPFPEQLP